MDSEKGHQTILSDKRFQFLVRLGFEIEDINKHVSHWCEGIIEGACDEYLRDVYCENIKTLKEKNFDYSFILYLFFVHTDSFSVYNSTFLERLELIEIELGPHYEGILTEDFWNKGECRLFDLIGWLTENKEEWMSEMREIYHSIKIDNLNDED